MDWLSRLQAAGFRPVGQWRMVAGGPVCQLTSHGSSSDVLHDCQPISTDMYHIGADSCHIAALRRGAHYTVSVANFFSGSN